MNRRIIALRGRGGIGKTTTIRLLADMLERAGWERISRVMHGNGIDITDVCRNKNGDLLGVESAGDNFREVNDALTILFGAGCELVICACRTRDMPDSNGLVQGTHFAMRQFTNNINFVNKTIVDRTNEAAKDRANLEDANNLLNRI